MSESHNEAPGASDARLTALLRADSPTAYPALRELRARHRPSVLAYARLCAASESAARQLATEVFTVATRETARGAEATVPWRHHLLLLTLRSAAAWATDEHATGLAPALLQALRTAGPDGPAPPPMLPAFESLPPRAQGLVWYGVVEHEPDDHTALLLGLTADDVAYRRESALHALRQACLRVRLAASEDPRCQDFHRLIEESVRPDTPRHSTDLQAHMEHCAHCTGAYDELCALRDDPRATLAEGLLPWGGTAYADAETGAETGAGDGGRPGPWTEEAEEANEAEEADEAEEGQPAAATATSAAAFPTTAVFAGEAWTTAGPESGGGTAAGAGAEAGTATGTGAGDRAGDRAGALSAVRPPARRLVLTSVALGVALVPLMAVLVFSGGSSPSDDAAGPVGTPAAPPPVSVTSTAPTTPASPTPSPTASRTERPSKPPKKPTRSPSPRPTRSPSPSKTGRPTPSLPFGPPLNGAYAQVVNIASGLCLDIRGALEKGTDVVTATCSARDTQRWRLDSDRDALQSFADPDLCLDSRGSTDDGVGIGKCDALDGGNGERLKFTVDSRGVIRPAIAPGHAVTPDKFGSVALAEAKGRDGQRWRAGAGPLRA